MTETPEEPEPESLHQARAQYHHPPKDVVPHNPRAGHPVPVGFGEGGQGHEVISYTVDEHGVRREVENVNLVTREFWGWELSHMNRQYRETRTGLLPRDIRALRKGGLSSRDIDLMERGRLSPRDIAEGRLTDE